MCASSCRLSKSGSAKREHEVVKVQAGLTMGQRESCELGVEWPVSPQMLQYCWHLQTGLSMLAERTTAVTDHQTYHLERGSIRPH